MQKRSTRNLIVAILTGLCGVAGTLATVLPAGELQHGAEKVAQACEANGIRAYPALDVAQPAPEVDAGTPSASPQPVLEQPASPFRGGERAELGERPLYLVPSQVLWHAPASRWVWLPAAESWPGEAKGWA